jgi:hypothetical protein
LEVFEALSGYQSCNSLCNLKEERALVMRWMKGFVNVSSISPRKLIFEALVPELRVVIDEKLNRLLD